MNWKQPDSKVYALTYKLLLNVLRLLNITLKHHT